MHRQTWLSPPVKYFTDHSKVAILLWIFYGGFSVLCLLCLCARLIICALWSPAGKGLTPWLSFVVSLSLSLSFFKVLYSKALEFSIVGISSDLT